MYEFMYLATEYLNEQITIRNWYRIAYVCLRLRVAKVVNVNPQGQYDIIDQASRFHRKKYLKLSVMIKDSEIEVFTALLL